MTSKHTIVIKTRLDDGIYKSHGGGEEVIQNTYHLGPINLLKAFRELDEIQSSNIRGYGSIGAGSSWIEIDGKEIQDYWLFLDEKQPLKSAKRFIAKNYT